jgi:hypothetical protein
MDLSGPGVDVKLKERKKEGTLSLDPRLPTQIEHEDFHKQHHEKLCNHFLNPLGSSCELSWLLTPTNSY